ncbi:MAG: O-antigen ligase family protein [Flavobacteriales bacterium]
MPESIGVTRLENILLPLLLVAVLGVTKFRSNKTIVYTLITLFAVTVFSNLLNLKGLEAYISSVRYIKYILLFLITGHLIKKNGATIHSMIDVFVIVLIVINLVQIFNLFDWGYELQKIYSNQSQVYELNRVFHRNFRLYGTQNNPNNNAVIWGMIAIYYYVKNLEKQQISNIVFLLFSIVFLLLTQSRTNLVGLVFSFTIYYFFKNLSIKMFFKLLAVFGCIFIAISFSGLSYIQQIIINNPFKVHSLQLRYEIWGSLIDLWKEYPLFGLGLETRFEDIVGNAPDNEFLYYLASGGILVIIPYAILFTSILTIGFKNIKSKNPYFGLYILLPIFLLVNSFTNYSLNNVKIAIFFFILLAFVNIAPKTSR